MRFYEKKAVGPALKRLALGVGLIVLFSSILLLTDLGHRNLVIALTEQVVARDQLTTLMVTHSMHQAATQGDRLIMMHRGQIIHDFQGAEKHRLRPDDLLARFEEVCRAEQLDESAADMLAEQYI
jgi:ABC-type uncharacterized transport system ATPase component